MLKKKQQIRDHTVNTKFQNIFKENKPKHTGGNKKGYQGKNPRTDHQKSERYGNSNSKKSPTEKSSGGFKGKRENFIESYDPTKKSKPNTKK